jgi:hypothetical protein
MHASSNHRSNAPDTHAQIGPSISALKICGRPTAAADAAAALGAAGMAALEGAEEEEEGEGASAVDEAVAVAVAAAVGAATGGAMAALAWSGLREASAGRGAASRRPRVSVRISVWTASCGRCA